MSDTGIRTIDALGKNMDHEDKKALKCCFVVLHVVYGQTYERYPVLSVATCLLFFKC